MKLNTTPRVNLDAASLRELRQHAQQVNALSEGRLVASYNAYTAAPTTGTYAQGDFIRNSAPADSGTTGNKYTLHGWVCVTGGTPGTWVQARYMTDDVSGGSGSVTSVAATVPSVFSISGSPITTSGTLAISYSGTALPVANGGTGATSLTAYAPVFGGTTSTGAVQSGTVGTAGHVLTSNGAGAIATFQAATGGGDVYKANVNVFTKNQKVTPASITSTTNSVAVDASLSNNFEHVLTENTTLAKPTNLTSGMHLFFHFTQHASSAKTLAFNSAYKFSTYDLHTIPTGASKVAIMSCYYHSGTDTLQCVFNSGGTGFA